jgi:hypothetical protein
MKNPNVTLKIILDNPQFFGSKDELDMKLISFKANITEEDVRNNMDLNWDFKYLARWLPWSFIEQHPDVDYGKDINENPNITLSIVRLIFSQS